MVTFLEMADTELRTLYVIRSLGGKGGPAYHINK